MKYILYNSQAGEGTCESEARILEVIYDEVEFIDMKRISSYETFFRGLEDDAEIILCGGDGTLNRFVNETQNIEIHNNIYYFSTGTGNDFARDLGHEKGANPDLHQPISEGVTVCRGEWQKAIILKQRWLWY